MELLQLWVPQQAQLLGFQYLPPLCQYWQVRPYLQHGQQSRRLEWLAWLWGTWRLAGMGTAAARIGMRGRRAAGGHQSRTGSKGTAGGTAAHQPERQAGKQAGLRGKRRRQQQRLACATAKLRATSCPARSVSSCWNLGVMDAR